MNLYYHVVSIVLQARLAQSAERKALHLVAVGSSPTVGVFVSHFLYLGFTYQLPEAPSRSLQPWALPTRWVFLRLLQTQVWSYGMCCFHTKLQLHQLPITTPCLCLRRSWQRARLIISRSWVRSSLEAFGPNKRFFRAWLSMRPWWPNG